MIESSLVICVAGELLQSLAGIEFTHIPYKTNAFPDLYGGRLDFIIAAPSVAVPQILMLRYGHRLSKDIEQLPALR